MSTTAAHALCAAVCLAAAPGTSLTNRQLARMAGTPSGYLVKIMARLARAGLVRSRRGRGGGFVLARRPSEISMYDVLTACDREDDGFGRPSRQACELERQIAAAAHEAEQRWRRVSIADLIVGCRSAGGCGMIGCRPATGDGGAA